MALATANTCNWSVDLLQVRNLGLGELALLFVVLASLSGGNIELHTLCTALVVLFVMAIGCCSKEGLVDSVDDRFDLGQSTSAPSETGYDSGRF